MLEELIRMNGEIQKDDSVVHRTLPTAALATPNLLMGLTSAQAKERLDQYGYNEIKRNTTASNLTIFFRQFQSTVILLLVVAAAISALSNEYIQTAAILVAVLINALIGFVTEVKAKVSLAALESLSGPTCRIVRDGSESQISARLIVPGDIVILDAGDRVPADLVLLEAASLSVEESMLTGESIPVYKKSQSPSFDVTTDDESCTAFQGTLILFGRAKGLVVETGENTKIGRLGKILQETISIRTPLEQQLEKLGQQLTWLTIIMCIGIFVVGALHHMHLFSLLQTSIALAVAAIPEGLPVVSTLALAAGTRRMIKAGALIRQLSAVETLGCTTVICTDKTGTLTENRMLVTDLVVLDRQVKITGRGYEPLGAVTENGSPISFEKDEQIQQLLHAAALCNDAKLERHANDELWHVHGDPTEGALLTAAAKAGLEHKKLQDLFPRVFEFPFDLKRKRMTTLHKSQTRVFSYIKGSPEVVIALCEYVRGRAGHQLLTPHWRSWFLKQNDVLTKRGLRVLAVATNELDATAECFEVTSVETNLTLLGLIAMADQPRENIEDSIKLCQEAGIRVLMVTGDQVHTAASIARTLNIVAPNSNNDTVLTGQELQQMSEDELDKKLKFAQVLAKVEPEMKLRVVRNLQENGEIVAMTGDGVNDAPALRQANIGVAMGLSGTALAREASNMVITDDNFRSIAQAVEQGRIIYSNIRQAIAYLLTASLTSVLAVFAFVLIDVGNAFTPLQLLWLNLIMHIFPGFALVLQPASEGIMSRPPRKAGEPFLTRALQIEIGKRSLVLTILVLTSVEMAKFLSLPKPYTIAFATLALSLIFQTISWAAVRQLSLGRFLGQIGNRSMLLNIGISIALLAVAIYFPPLQKLLETSALSPTSLGVVLLLSAISFVLTFKINSKILN